MSKPAVCNLRLSLDHNCAKCLLETYVKRSLIRNEVFRKNQLKQLKRVKQGEQASSDTSTHRLSIEELLSSSKCPRCTTSAIAVQHKIRLQKVIKSFSFSPSPKNEEILQKKFGKVTVEKKEPLQKDATFFFGSEEELSDVCKGSNKIYFQRMSMELEAIVNEIQLPPEDDSASLPSAACLSDCSSAGDGSVDIAEKIFRLLKQEGDIIDKKISRNKSVKDFLQKLSYSSFQQMADRYVAQIPSPLPQTTDASPEVVRLAFTLDFTAKVATLCVQTFSLIMGYGHQYLQDSFMQMCSTQKTEPEDS